MASDGAEIPSAAPPKETPLPPDPAPAPAPLAAPPTAPSEASKAPVQAIPIASYMDLDRRDNPNHTCISTAVGVSSTAVGGVASDIAKVIVPSTLNPTSKQEGSSGWAKSRDEPEDSPEQASWLEDFEKEQRSNQEAAGAGKEDVAAAVPGGDKLRKRGWAFRGTSAAASEPIDPGAFPLQACCDKVDSIELLLGATDARTPTTTSIDSQRPATTHNKLGGDGVFVVPSNGYEVARALCGLCASNCTCACPVYTHAHVRAFSRAPCVAVESVREVACEMILIFDWLTLLAEYRVQGHICSASTTSGRKNRADKKAAKNLEASPIINSPESNSIPNL